MMSYKVGLISLLVLGAMVVGLNPEAAKGARACPLYCLDVEYVTCPSSGNDKLPSRCNCCLAPKGCTLHLSDASSIHCN